MNYYNENDPFAASWLEALINGRCVPLGHVDRRSIADVTRVDVAGYAACHFFAGIGGWPLALRMAGWPDWLNVWTGSCPCQPFSNSGKRRGVADERHLWPTWRERIREARPSVVFGEQVASADGRTWMADVRADLENMGYEVGCADLCAAGIGAPHIRQRLFFVADRQDDRLSGQQDAAEPAGRHVITHGGTYGVADDDNARLAIGRRVEIGPGAIRHERPTAGARGVENWSDIEWLPCTDGKWRPTKPGLFPLAHGVSNRVGKIRGYGNAIVPALAAEFITAYMEARGI